MPGVNEIQIDGALRVGAKESGKYRTIIAKFRSCKDKQWVLSKARHQKRKDVYVYEDFSKVKGLRQIWYCVSKKGSVI